MKAFFIGFFGFIAITLVLSNQNVIQGFKHAQEKVFSVLSLRSVDDPELFLASVNSAVDKDNKKEEKAKEKEIKKAEKEKKNKDKPDSQNNENENSEDTPDYENDPETEIDSNTDIIPTENDIASEADEGTEENSSTAQEEELPDSNTAGVVLKENSNSDNSNTSTQVQSEVSQSSDPVNNNSGTNSNTNAATNTGTANGVSGGSRVGSSSAYTLDSNAQNINVEKEAILETKSLMTKITDLFHLSNTNTNTNTKTDTKTKTQKAFQNKTVLNSSFSDTSGALDSSDFIQEEGAKGEGHKGFWAKTYDSLSNENIIKFFKNIFSEISDFWSEKVKEPIASLFDSALEKAISLPQNASVVDTNI